MAQNSVGGDAGGLAQTLSRRDLQQIERAACRGAPITPENRKRSIECCLAIIDATAKVSKRTKISAIRALAALEALDLRDVHHIERMQHESGILDLRMRRAEEGKPNDCFAVHVNPARELPLPDALREYRKRLLEPSDS